MVRGSSLGFRVVVAWAYMYSSVTWGAHQYYGTMAPACVMCGRTDLVSFCEVSASLGLVTLCVG